MDTRGSGETRYEGLMVKRCEVTEEVIYVFKSGGRLMWSPVSVEFWSQSANFAKEQASLCVFVRAKAVVVVCARCRLLHNA